MFFDVSPSNYAGTKPFEVSPLLRIKMQPWQVALIASTFMAIANNRAIIASLGAELELFSVDGISFVLTVLLLIVFILNTIFLLLGIGRLMQITIATFLVATAVFAYFSNEIGVIFDEQMFLNTAETIRDQNTGEALELVSLPFISYVFLFGIIPSMLLFFVEIVPRTFTIEFGSRVIVTLVGLMLVAVSGLPNSQFITYFAIEHRELRFRVMPIFPLVSLVKLARDQQHHDESFHVIDGKATQQPHMGTRTIGIVVVGETARADHFSLDGYIKDTNPLLGNTKDLLYVHANSCGTSTLYSVPCMFSMKDHNDYAPGAAATESNVLDILTTAGVKTVWLDNNSSCKHVCDRIENVNLRQNIDKSSPYYSDMGYFDEALIEKLDDYLGSEGSDLLLVLHTLGSHGPAYGRRFPARFGKFTPYCQKLSPTECTREEVANAYDNTILYTDYILSHIIEKLRANPAGSGSFLLYASDHGESLGENGVYLHGLPYSIAPQAQTRVPMVMWISPNFRHDHDFDPWAIAGFGTQSVSHDNISHTLLGLFGIKASSYNAGLDLFPQDNNDQSRKAG